MKKILEYISTGKSKSESVRLESSYRLYFLADGTFLLLFA